MQKLEFTLPIKASLVFYLVWIVACKPSTIQDAPFSFVGNLSIGVYEYNEHSVSIEPLFDCRDQPYCPALQISFPAQTKKAFEAMGWNDALINDFLQTESYEPYNDQVDFHLLVFLFQSQGQTYMRVVNQFAHTVTTKPLIKQKKLKIEELLQAENIVFIHSKPTLADVYVDGSILSEAPLWLYSNQKMISIRCKLPESTSTIIRFELGSAASLRCEL